MITIEDFLRKIEDELEDIEPGTLLPDTRIHGIHEWDSMSALLVMAMIDKEFNKSLSGNDIKMAHTLADLYNKAISS